MIKVNKIYLIIYIAILIIAMINGGILFYYVFYCMTFLLFAAVQYILLIRIFLKVDTDIKTCVSSVGDTAVCRAIVKTEIEIPIPYIEIKTTNWEKYNDEYNGKLVNVPFDQSLWIDCKLQFKKRGIYNPAEIAVTYFDLFKIITVARNYSNGNTIKVYPKIFEIERQSDLQKDIFTEENKGHNFREDLYLIKDLREYRQGDNLKNIHWKLSAKLSELFVKNREELNGEGAVILADFNKNNYNYGIEETVCDSFMSIVYLLIKNSIRTKSYINSCDAASFIIKEKDEFNDLMEYMVNKKSDGELYFHEFINSVCGKFPENSAIIIVTGIIDNNLRISLEYYSKIGYKFTVVYCAESRETKENSLYLIDIGIYTIDISAINKKNVEWWG